MGLVQTTSASRWSRSLGGVAVRRPRWFRVLVQTSLVCDFFGPPVEVCCRTTTLYLSLRLLPGVLRSAVLTFVVGAEDFLWRWPMTCVAVLCTLMSGLMRDCVFSLVYVSLTFLVMFMFICCKYCY